VKTVVKQTAKVVFSEIPGLTAGGYANDCITIADRTLKLLRDGATSEQTAVHTATLSFAKIFCLSVQHEAVLAVCSTTTDRTVWLLESGKHQPTPVPVECDGAAKLVEAAAPRQPNEAARSIFGTAYLMGGTLMWQPSSTPPPLMLACSVLVL